MNNTENFLIDKDFLRLLDLESNKEIFVKIISLDFNENPIEEIEGRVTQGSVTVDGSSSVRRTCSLSLVANELNIHNFYWGLNTKFKLYVGISNTVKQKQLYKQLYSNYPDICWFKMGTYIISTFNTSQSTNSYTINIQGKDKMTMLNGDIGGVITPLTWDFGKIDEISSNGTITTKDYLLKDIILEAVHEHAQEPYWNIIINDLDDYGLELLEYQGDIPLYLLYNIEQGVVDQMLFDVSEFKDPEEIKYDYRILQLEGQFDQPDVFTINGQQYTIIKAEYGDVIGYRTTELTYPGDLISNVGETVTSMLDKIVQMLGEFEYFYDLEGRFIFQRKKTYIQSNFSTITHNDIATNEIYVKNAAETSSCQYSFDNSILITSFSNSPDFNNLKNDYSLWGARKGINGIEIPIHLRYAIDTKPWFYKAYNQKIYITSQGYNKYEDLMTEYKEWYKKQQEENAAMNGKSIFKKIAVPDFLKEEDGSSKWWDLTNWAEYYALLTGELPSLEIFNYGTIGFQGSLTFPDGTVRNFINQLVIDLERDTHNPFYGNGPEINAVGHKTGYKYVSASSGRESESQAAWSPFQHGFNNCYHTYREFLYLDANNNCQSFIYNPEIPQVALTDDVIAIMDSIIIDDLNLDYDNTIECDWRELIYQMALDYIKHHHEEDFLIQIDKNNTLPDNTHLYIGGYTGYEQYYIDLQGFWRELYDPTYKFSYQITGVNKTKFNSHKQDYFIYQNCEEFSYEDMIAAAQAWKTLCGGTIYTYNYKHQPIALTSVPDRTAFEKHPDQYCFIRRCDALAPGDKIYLQALEYDRHDTYYTQTTDEYNLETHWSSVVTENPEGLNFWFDFLDTEGELNQYKVNKVGDRTKASNDKNITSIYFRDVPTVIFVNSQTDIATEKAKKGSGYTYIKLPTYLENLFSMSTQGKSAMDVLNEWIYSYAYCTESITINALPVYYLEPNTRIMVRDDNSGINGEYIVTRLTFPLTHNGTMSITANKAVENLY